MARTAPHSACTSSTSWCAKRKSRRIRRMRSMRKSRITRRSMSARSSTFCWIIGRNQTSMTLVNTRKASNIYQAFLNHLQRSATSLRTISTRKISVKTESDRNHPRLNLSVSRWSVSTTTTAALIRMAPPKTISKRFEPTHVSESLGCSTSEMVAKLVTRSMPAPSWAAPGGMSSGSPGYNSGHQRRSWRSSRRNPRGAHATAAAGTAIAPADVRSSGQ
mmetsp:Transcript_113009/g.314484  ORF Transcript_113009/g.314484 Transcript_113009/m.314484 type:complete len:219 (+) Transcript_113009:1401-2057(+)